MLILPPSVHIYVARDPADMRRGIDGLAALTTSVLGNDPFSGHLFLFANRRRDRIKILYWDRSGYCLWLKRLEKGTFHLPLATGPSVRMEAGHLALILEGIDLSQARRLPRYSRPEPTPTGT